MQLRALDLAIIVAYLAGVIALGWVFSRKQKDTRDYFLSDHGVPWWALAASIVAISSIHLLKAFMNVSVVSNDKLLWLVVIHLTFVVSALMLAVMDRIVVIQR